MENVNVDISNLYWLLFISVALVSWLVSSSFQRKIDKFSKVSLPYTGRDVAQRMLQYYGITDVKITCIRGQLTDHYNPLTKTVNLSEAVYHNANVSAAAVAAHECGHAVQHAQSYVFLTLRSKLVPVVNFCSTWMSWVILGGILLITTFPALLWFGVGLYAVTTLFSFVTLPVEIDASRRAIAWLEESGITTRETEGMAAEALRGAAYTYVVAALASLATLIYYVLILLKNK